MVFPAADGPVTRPAPAPTGVRLPVTPRALIVGVIGAAIACFVVSWAELVVTSIQIAICQFAPAAIGLLFVLVLGNLLVRSVARRLRLRPHEIIVIYLMI
ncbi:hypothetical protein LLH23_20150, partial [bacterium]|nr:hypothetical protein [bacterium]